VIAVRLHIGYKNYLYILTHLDKCGINFGLLSFVLSIPKLSWVNQEFWILQGQAERCVLSHWKYDESLSFSLPNIHSSPRERVPRSTRFQFIWFNYLSPLCENSTGKGLSAKQFHDDKRKKGVDPWWSYWTMLCGLNWFIQHFKQWSVVFKNKELLHIFSKEEIVWKFTKALVSWQGGFMNI